MTCQHETEAMTVAWPVWIVSSMANLDNAWPSPFNCKSIDLWHCIDKLCAESTASMMRRITRGASLPEARGR